MSHVKSDGQSAELVHVELQDGFGVGVGVGASVGVGVGTGVALPVGVGDGDSEGVGVGLGGGVWPLEQPPQLINTPPDIMLPLAPPELFEQSNCTTEHGGIDEDIPQSPPPTFVVQEVTTGQLIPDTEH